MIYQTNRLILRNFKETDLDSFLSYRNDREIAMFQSWDYPISIDKAREFIMRQSKMKMGYVDEWMQIALERKVDQAHIGDCAFKMSLDKKQGEFGITIAHGFQKKGYAIEASQGLFEVAFGELQIHRIIGLVDFENYSSISLQEKLGMRKEAHFVKSYWDHRLNEWRDEFQYAILREEWLK